MGKKKRKKKICVMEKNWSTHNPRNQTRRRTKRTTNLPYFWAFLFPFFFLTRQNSVVWAMRSSQEELGIQLPPFTIVQAPKQKNKFLLSDLRSLRAIENAACFLSVQRNSARGEILLYILSFFLSSFLPFFLPAALVSPIGVPTPIQALFVPSSCPVRAQFVRTILPCWRIQGNRDLDFSPPSSSFDQCCHQRRRKDKCTESSGRGNFFLAKLR